MALKCTNMEKKRVLLFLHIPVILLAILTAWFFSADDVPEGRKWYTTLTTLVMVIWMLASFYAFYSFLVPRYLKKDDRKHFWLWSLLFVLVVMPVLGMAMLLVTGTSALGLSETLSAEGLMPYVGSVIITLVCSILGVLYRLLLERFHTA
jgi:hypothetical protein